MAARPPTGNLRTQDLRTCGPKAKLPGPRRALDAKQPFPPLLVGVRWRRRRLRWWWKDDRFAQGRGRGAVEFHDDIRGLLGQLHADTFGGLSPLIDQAVVLAIALELVVEGDGIEPVRKDLTPRHFAAA